MIVLVLLAAGVGIQTGLSRLAAVQRQLASQVGTLPPTPSASPSGSPDPAPIGGADPTSGTSPDPVQSPPPSAGHPEQVSFGATWLADHPQPDLPVKAQAAVLFDVDAHQVLWQRDPTGRRSPASLTKLVTAMVAADVAPLDRQIQVTAATDTAAVQQVEPASTVMGLGAGEKLSVRELLFGIFLRSGNDAAETLAAGTVGRDRFVALMNAKVGELGMAGSHFSSPVGLDATDQYSTAWDLGIAAATIVARYPQLLAISGTGGMQLAQTPTHKVYDLTNYNKLVRSDQPEYYSGATGMKTAFTDDAGACLVASAQRGNRRLVAVFLHSDDFFADAHTLLDYGFRVGPVT